jgi:hypothetical protein
MRTAPESRRTTNGRSEAVTVHQPSIRAREAAHDVVFEVDDWWIVEGGRPNQ